MTAILEEIAMSATPILKDCVLIKQARTNKPDKLRINTHQNGLAVSDPFSMKRAKVTVFVCSQSRFWEESQHQITW